MYNNAERFQKSNIVRCMDEHTCSSQANSINKKFNLRFPPGFHFAEINLCQIFVSSFALDGRAKKTATERKIMHNAVHRAVRTNAMASQNYRHSSNIAKTPRGGSI